MVKQSRVPIAICMFIDGLDEMDGDHHSSVGLIKNLADQDNVKICLSSRPLLVFEEAFSVAPSLKLQDLTYHSIGAYADAQLSGLVQGQVDKREIHRVKRLVTSIVSRADGVFLWAVIAIRDVRDGLRDIVDLDELTQTVDNLPSQLESLFMLMLNRIKPAYQRDAARFLQIALCYPLPGLYNTLTLCDVYFVHSQKSSEDDPLVYGKLATSEIVEACQTLKTRLSSHTAGLLDLIPSKHKYEACFLHDITEPLLHTRITFLHRTARDFLHENDQAKSFLAGKGYTQAEVHIRIARGILSHLAQASEHMPSQDSNYRRQCYEYSHQHFRDGLRQIALAERLLGAAQHGLMQSLDYSLYDRNFVKTSEKSYWQEVPFVVDADVGLVDLVGLAASVGMTIYICDRLNIPYESRKDDPEKSYLGQSGFDRSNPATLVWSEPRSVEDSGGCLAFLRQPSDYRQTLRQFLQVKSDAANPQKDQRWASDAFAETYLLACCFPTRHDLVQILLRAGANPMVTVTNNPSTEKLWRRYAPPLSFWRQWLAFLQDLRYGYMKVNHRSGGFLLNDYYRSLGLTERYVLDTTNFLLASGVDVNQTTKSADSLSYKCYLKRGDRIDFKDDGDNGFDLILQATAMFTLEECFSKEPEFRKIADALSSSMQRPTRWLVEIRPPYGSTGDRPHNLSLSVEDCETLWPLIENWEGSGSAHDRQVLKSTMERMWKDAHPETDFTQKVDDDAISQSTDEL